MKRRLLLIVLCAVVLLVLFVVAFWRPITLMVNAPATDSLKDDSLTFLREVIGFNMSQYEIVDAHFWPQIDVVSRNGLPLYLMRYDLKSSDDEAWVDIYYTQSEGSYIHEPYFSVYSNALFSPAYPSDKVLNWTKDFFERYQTYQNNASYVLDMQKTLDLVDHIQPLNVTSGDVKLQIDIKEFTEQDIYTTLRFSPLNSTAKDSDDAVTFEFHNGVMLSFSNWYGVNRSKVQ